MSCENHGKKLLLVAKEWQYFSGTLEKESNTFLVDRLVEVDSVKEAENYFLICEECSLPVTMNNVHLEWA
tara:strand:+ start:393 stop:602 length:210 start_codon:yes stop_codon:yes gene_type:complete